ncbi:MAG: PAS domain-containing protein [Deltaproteobacteria bacterium]|nr:PAS domain-containing protein [Deltaproteobacteria bacterium]
MESTVAPPSASPLQGSLPLWVLLEALPTAALLTDRDLRVTYRNELAARLAERSPPPETAAARPGDLLQCVHAVQSLEGCGSSPPCLECPVRQAAEQVLDGRSILQREVQVQRSGGPLVFLLSGSPLALEGEVFALLLIQDVTALHRLRGLIPICSSCKKIRKDDDAWEVLEAYLERHSHAEFTHGLCPDCRRELYPRREDPTTPSPK